MKATTLNRFGIPISQRTSKVLKSTEESTYKILSGIYDIKTCEDLFITQEDTSTRCYGKKIYMRRLRLNRRNYAFCDQMVNTWNNLQDDVVNAATISTFEKKLDNHWTTDECMYDHRPYSDHLTQTRNHNTIMVLTWSWSHRPSQSLFQKSSVFCKQHYQLALFCCLDNSVFVYYLPFTLAIKRAASTMFYVVIS